MVRDLMSDDDAAREATAQDRADRGAAGHTAVMAPDRADRGATDDTAAMPLACAVRGAPRKVAA